MMKKTVIHILAGLTLAMLLAGCAATRSGGEASAGGINPAESTTPRQASAASESADDAAADWTEAVGKGKIGFQMPDFSVPTVSGETFTLSQTLKERELVLINLWASWCGPCVHEFPFLQQAYEANQDRVDVIALSVEQGDSLEKLKQFSEENHVSFQIGQDENLRLAQCFNVTSIPTSLLVDRSGKVVWMQTGAMRSAEDVKRLFERYGVNFIVQEKVKQHPDLQRVNATSLNSMRLYTYRHLDGSCEFLYPFAHMRFGGKGAIKDNVSQGGGTCLIHPDGRVDDKVFRFKRMDVSSLKQETGVEGLVVPNYQAVIDALLRLHARLPYFDFVGWDVTVLPDGEPLLIEFNLVPSVEGPQMMAGPMFGDCLEEVLDRARKVVCDRVQSNKKSFAKGFRFYLHMQ